jgi:hypothetical protein
VWRCTDTWHDGSAGACLLPLSLDFGNLPKYHPEHSSPFTFQLTFLPVCAISLSFLQGLTPAALFQTCSMLVLGTSCVVYDSSVVRVEYSTLVMACFPLGNSSVYINSRRTIDPSAFTLFPHFGYGCWYCCISPLAIKTSLALGWRTGF